MTGSIAARQFHLAFDDGGGSFDLAGDKDAEPVRVVVAAIAPVDVDAPNLEAHVLLDVADRGLERMAVEGIAVKRLGVEDELTALGLGDGCGDRDLAAELVGRSRLAFADAFDFGGGQSAGNNHRLREVQRTRKYRPPGARAARARFARGPNMRNTRAAIQEFGCVLCLLESLRPPSFASRRARRSIPLSARQQADRVPDLPTGPSLWTRPNCRPPSSSGESRVLVRLLRRCLRLTRSRSCAVGRA